MIHGLDKEEVKDEYNLDLINEVDSQLTYEVFVFAVAQSCIFGI